MNRLGLWRLRIPLVILGGLTIMGLSTAAGIQTAPYILPDSIQHTINPGQSLVIPITIKHDSPQDQVSIVPAGNALNGGLAFPIGSGSAVRADESPFFPRADYRLSPNGPGHYLLTVHVPPHSAPGLYESGIAVAHTEPTQTTHGKNHTIIHLRTIARTVVVMQWIVPGTVKAISPTLGRPVTQMTPQGLATTLSITNPQRTIFRGPLSVTLSIHEAGRTIFTAHDRMSDIQPISTVWGPPILWKFAVAPGTYTVSESAPGLGVQHATQIVSPTVAKNSQQAVATVTHQAPVVTSIWQFIPAWVWGVLAMFFVTILGYLIWSLRRMRATHHQT